MPCNEFFVCRVLFTKPDRLDFVVIEGAEISRRNDVQLASNRFSTEEEAKEFIGQIGGTIPTGAAMFLDYFEEDARKLWCWKDERTFGSSQTFASERKAMAAWHADELVFDAMMS